MNLIEESFQNKEQKKKKRTSIIILSIIILLVIAIISIAAYLIYLQNSTLKLFLNGKENDKLKQLLMIESDGTVYVPIKEVAEYLEYESYNGEYMEKSEETSKCYVQNEKEVANFTLGSNKIYKLDLTDSKENYEYAYAKNPVKASNGVLYASSEMIEQAFNVSFQYDQEKNRIQIYTMPYLIQNYSSRILDYGYAEISDVFANQKTILKDMIVVKKDKDKDIYGVITVQGDVILENKYDNITYLPNVGDFLVETNKKVGILSKSGQTKVQIIYDSIELMDSDAKLYVAEKDDKYGVIDFNGNIKVYIENDEIGMDISQFDKNNIKSKYLLMENLIPVRRDKLWALYDKNGKQIVDFKYDVFGYVASNSKNNTFNLLVIPDYNVLVACTNKKYTLLNSSGEELFAPVADAIYMTIEGQKKHYEILANNQQHDAEELLDKSGISVNTTNQNQTTKSTNTNSVNNNQDTQRSTMQENNDQTNSEEQ